MARRASTRKPKAEAAPRSTAQRLDAIVKSVRAKLRKDKGLDGDTDRLPLLAWLMFLKLLDDVERVREGEAAMAGAAFHPVVEPPYRWRDWAAPADGLTGDDLLRFFTAETDALLPDGKRGPGLIATLRALRAEGVRDRRAVVATVFDGVFLKARSGHILREVVELVSGIHFDAADEVFQLSRLYEGMLRQLRDAAGSAGEYYTPRPVVRFMVQALDPRLGELVEDPACGTAGFLVEAFHHLRAQRRTTEDERTLQDRSIRGGEAKPLPFLLGQMNLLLHGLDAPEIDPGNALRHRLAELGEAQRVDVILTNPPFGGEEETSVLGNFPADRRTSETALLFLQLIMRKLRRGGRGRAAVVVPNGTLFEGGVAARIKADLLEGYDLRAVVRLPEGVFAPYTDIPANVLFFATGGPTREVAYWEQKLPEGRRKFTKTQPMLDGDLADALAWFRAGFPDDPRAWKVPVEGLVQKDEAGRVVTCNLDVKNPRAAEQEDHRAPAEIVEAAIEMEQEALRLLKELRVLVEHASEFRRVVHGAPLVRLGDIAPLVRRSIVVDPDMTYTEIGVRSFFKGTFHRRTVQGSDFTWQELFAVKQGDLIFSNLMAWEGAVAVAGVQDDGCVGNHRMLTCEVDSELAHPAFLAFHLQQPAGLAQLIAASPGSIARNRTLGPEALASLQVPLPGLEAQLSFVAMQEKARAVLAAQRAASAELEGLLPSLLHGASGDATSNGPLRDAA